MNFASAVGRAEAEMRHAVEVAARQDFGDAVDMAADHMAAELVADPQRALQIDLRPLAKPPSVVTASVSAPTSKVIAGAAIARARPRPTVRQTPAWATDAPTRPTRIVAAGDDQPSFARLGVISMTSPTSVTIPVNIGRRPRRFRESIEILDDHGLALGRAPGFSLALSSCYGAEQGEQSPCSVFTFHTSIFVQVFEAPQITR